MGDVSGSFGCDVQSYFSIYIIICTLFRGFLFMFTLTWYYFTYLLDRSREYTVFLQITRLSIMAATSTVVVVPVSLLSWSTFVVLGRPLLSCPCVGSPRIKRWATSSECRWQCPAHRSLMAPILSLSFDSDPKGSRLAFFHSSVHWGLFLALWYKYHQLPSPLHLWTSMLHIHTAGWTRRCNKEFSFKLYAHGRFPYSFHVIECLPG